MLEGKELREFAKGSSLFRGAASDVHHGRLNVIQDKGARVSEEICIPQLNLLSQSIEHLLDLEVVVQDGGVC